jgi:uncharacterized protein (DUF433 family)
MNRFDRITLDPREMAGFPCIRHLPICVSTIVEKVRCGKTNAEILAEYPTLQPEDIRQAMGYASAVWSRDAHLCN